MFITIPSIDLSTRHVVEINELTKPIYSGPKEAAEFVSNGLNRSPIATYEEEDSVELRKKIEADHDATVKALLVSFFRGPNSGPKHRKTA